MKINAPTEALELFAYHLAQEMLHSTDGLGELTLATKFVEGVYHAHATLNEKSADESASLKEHFTDKRAENVACGKALFALFSQIHPLSVPYGTLVGVRPVKIALFYYEHGLKRTEVQKLLIQDYCMQKRTAALLCDLAQLESETSRSLCSNDAMLYLSIPFCPSRCRYCSFVSHSAPKQLALLPEYLLRMQEELQETAELFSTTKRHLRAVYLGGGTPGLLEKADLHDLFETIHRHFPLAESVEYTAELGRPDTITKEKCAELTSLGVGRICINPQSLDDNVLKLNGRHHTADDFYRAYEFAKSANIPSINTDLIAGLVGDTPDGFLNTLEKILNLSPENLTVHALCKKRASDEENAVSNDEEGHWSAAMKLAQTACIKNGYRPYYLYRQKNTIANLENLGYAKEGHDCLYNIAMMEDLCDVFAVGAGAMTKLRKNTEDGYTMIRLPSYKYPAEYLNDPQKGRLNRKKAKELCME